VSIILRATSARTYTSFIRFEKDVNRDPKPESRAIQLQKRSRATNRRCIPGSIRQFPFSVKEIWEASEFLNVQVQQYARTFL